MSTAAPTGTPSPADAPPPTGGPSGANSSAPTSTPTLTNSHEGEDGRRFALIWLAQLIAKTGNGLTPFALTIYAYQHTGLSTSVALITMAGFLPVVLLAPPAGVLADRFDRTRLMAIGNIICAVALGLVWATMRTAADNMVLICLTLALVSVGAALLDPAYRAVITDLLPPERYAKASGLVQLASAAQLIVAPAVAGVLMARSTILIVIAIDIAMTTVAALLMVLIAMHAHPGQDSQRELIDGSQNTGVQEAGFQDAAQQGGAPEGAARQGTGLESAAQEDLAPQAATQHDGATASGSGLRDALEYLAGARGVLALVGLATLITFCMGFLQTLLTPLMLDLTSEDTLGIIRSGAAVGMLVSSLIIGVVGMGTHHRRFMAIFLALGGILVAGIGMTTNVLAIGVLCAAFFMTLPPLNTSVEVLARCAIPNQAQGRVWGLIGFISQLGYILAYAVSGLLADHVFTPLLQPGGPLASSLGTIMGTGPSRGIGIMFALVGLALIALAVAVPFIASVARIEQALRLDLDHQRGRL